ncbi:MAG: hypothetical protein IIY94_08135 [Oscillospiraceae bacterium]|nr:hypothetical protein [Oscillospiraceae bacterium]
MSQNENSREPMNAIDAEQNMEAELLPERDAPAYVESPKSTRILAWVLLVLVVTGVILYYLWIAGILHI